MPARLSKAQAAALGIGTPPPPPSSSSAKRRRPPTPQPSRCFDCGERFDTEAAASRHNRDTRHCRFELELDGDVGGEP